MAQIPVVLMPCRPEAQPLQAPPAASAISGTPATSPSTIAPCAIDVLPPGGLFLGRASARS
jgi:hypothetical protein